MTITLTQAQNDAIYKPENKAAAGRIGKLAGHAVKPLKFAATRAGALGGAIGRNVKEFFTTKLPAAFSVKTSVTSNTVANNLHLDKPFDETTSKGIINELKSGFTSDKSFSPITLNVDNKDAKAQVATIFARDIGNRIGQFQYNGSNISDKNYDSVSDDYSRREQAIDFYNVLSTDGVKNDDIFVISTICNQSLFGAFQAYSYSTSGNLNMQLPNGNSAVPSFGDDRTTWNIIKKDQGFDIEISASGPLAALPEKETGDLFLFSNESRITLKFNIELRGEDKLEIANLGGNMNVEAYGQDGTPLTPAARAAISSRST